MGKLELKQRLRRSHDRSGRRLGRSDRSDNPLSSALDGAREMRVSFASCAYTQPLAVLWPRAMPPIVPWRGHKAGRYDSTSDAGSEIRRTGGADNYGDSNISIFSCDI